MRAFLAVPFALVLLLPPAPAEPVPTGFQATAAGTVALTLTDTWFWEVRCDGVAAGVAVEGGELSGAIAWHAPDCPDLSTWATPFTTRCSDACFPGCWVDVAEVRCSGGFALDGAYVWEAFTLQRNGSFSYVRDVWGQDYGYRVEASGLLLVLTWPDPL